MVVFWWGCDEQLGRTVYEFIGVNNKELRALDEYCLDMVRRI